jgi:hypothetical protein
MYVQREVSPIGISGTLGTLSILNILGLGGVVATIPLNQPQKSIYTCSICIFLRWTLRIVGKLIFFSLPPLPTFSLLYLLLRTYMRIYVSYF